MVVIYSEIDIVDQFLLFESDSPHWNSIIKSGIHICINITSEELNEKLGDPEDPLFIAFNDSATMTLPIALKKGIENIKADLSITVDYPRSIFLIDIDKEAAKKAQKDFGTAVYSVNDYPDNLLGFSCYHDLHKNQLISAGWKGLLNFEKPLSNSLVITDNHYFKNEDNGINRGFSNLVSFVDAFLPEELSIEYHITIFAEDCNKRNDWWVKEYGKLVALIKPLRIFEINIELVLTSTIHRRRLVSNYAYGKTDQGYDVFHAKEIEKVNLDNDFEHLEIFSNLTNSGTKHFQSANITIEKLEKRYKSVSDFVIAKGNEPGRMLFGCNKDKTIKNRLLN